RDRDRHRKAWPGARNPQERPARRDALRGNRQGRAAAQLPPGRPGGVSVIPAPLGGRNPESRNPGLWNMDSGFAAAPRSGMTEKGNIEAMAAATDVQRLHTF